MYCKELWLMRPVLKTIIRNYLILYIDYSNLIQVMETCVKNSGDLAHQDILTHFLFQVMETCVKNCGDLVHQEIGTKAFMEEMRDLVKQTTDDNIKTKEIHFIF